MVRGSRLSTLRKDRNKLDPVHFDLSGPFPVLSHGNSLYYITLIDDASRVAWVRFMKPKLETSKIINDFVVEMKLQNHKTPKAFRMDNGREHVPNNLKWFFESMGIIHDFTPPYAPESNRAAERLNRTIEEALTAILQNATTYDKKLWAEAVLTSVYIENRQPHSALKDRTPYEAFYGRKQLIQHLQPFGRECYIHVPYQKRKHREKSSPRAQKSIFTRYTNTINHYGAFLPDTKTTIVLADCPSLMIELASPCIHPQINQHLIPFRSQETSVGYTYTNRGKSSDELLRQWMREHLQEANNLADNGHTSMD